MGAWEDLNDNMNQAEAPYTLRLPPWDEIRASNPPALNPVLIPGIVRKGYTIEVGGKAKVGKSMFAIGLVVRVVCGGDFCGREIQGGGRCLYVDPEIHPYELHKRFNRVCWSMGADAHKIDANVVKWSLRGATTPEGKPPTITDIAHDIEARCKPGDFDLIVLDSCAALLEGNENESQTIRAFYNAVLRIAEATGATVLFVVHFGKAKDGDRDPADRARGSSAWTDCPDAILTLVETFPKDGDPSDYLQPGEIACLLESGGLRSFGRMAAVPLIFRYPNPNTNPEPVPPHRLDVEGITDGWKPNSSNGQSRGGKQTGELNATRAERDWSNDQLKLAAEFVRRGIGAEGMPMTEAAQILDIRSDKLRDKLKDKGSDLFTYDKRGNKNYLVVRDMPEPPPSLDLDE